MKQDEITIEMMPAGLLYVTCFIYGFDGCNKFRVLNAVIGSGAYH